MMRPFPVTIYSERPWYEFMGQGESVMYERTTGKYFVCRVDPDYSHYLVVLRERGYDDTPAGVASDPRFD